MASQIYSYPFIAAVGLNGEQTYTVPPGYVAVLRDLDGYWGGGIGGAEAYLRGAIGQTLYHWGRSSPDSTSFQWRGRQALAPGATFSVVTTTPIDITVSGYLLVGTMP